MRRVISIMTILAAAATAATAEARSPRQPRRIVMEETARPIDMTVLDDTMLHDMADPDETWRLPDGQWQDDTVDDDLRLRVKVRPNRAMGRMSLSF